MNILNMVIALKDIKIKELDDEFQIIIFKFFNEDPDIDITITDTMTGSEIRGLIENQGALVRSKIFNKSIINDSQTIVRFYAGVDKIQDNLQQKIIYDDAVKETFFINFGFFIIIVVALCMGLYHLSKDSRGYIPPSGIATVVGIIFEGLHGDNGYFVDPPPPP